MPRSFLVTNKRYIEPDPSVLERQRWTGTIPAFSPATISPTAVQSGGPSINNLSANPMDLYKAFLAATLCTLSQEPVNLKKTSQNFANCDQESSLTTKCLPSPQSSMSDSESFNGSGYSCDDCGKVYSTSSNLARHRQVHRSNDDRKARTCPHCAKVYVSMPAFSMHVRTHSQGCGCHICGKSFSRPWLLQGHLRTHSGERPFRCEICPKSFADKSNLRAHMQTHSNEKPYTCQTCGKSFALKSYLYKHEEASCLKGRRKKPKP